MVNEVNLNKGLFGYDQAFQAEARTSASSIIGFLFQVHEIILEK